MSSRQPQRPVKRPEPAQRQVSIIIGGLLPTPETPPSTGPPFTLLMMGVGR